MLVFCIMESNSLEKGGKMKKYRIKVGLDVDDTLYECNSYALDILNKRYPDEEPMTINEIKSWGRCGRHFDERLELYTDPEFVRTQPIMPGAQKLVRELLKIADVFFVTAVHPKCMSARAEHLIKDFPDVPSENIIMGTRKDVVMLDILLDDGAHNISSSQAAYPVLLRRPWNTNLSGLISVNSYDDFLHFCKMARSSFTDKSPDLSKGGVICLVGPSGSLKNDVAYKLIEDERYEKPTTSTTRACRENECPNAYRFISEEQFVSERNAGKFIETTVYGSNHYGTSADQIIPIVERGNCAVIPIDICGALTLKNLYRSRAILIFMNRNREAVLADILKRKITDEEKISRIMALDFEYQNAEICDTSVDVSDSADEAAATIKRIIDGKH